MAVKSVRKVRPLKPEVETMQPQVPAAIEDDPLRQRIAQAAYYRAQRRGFSPGKEMEDWLAAETEVRAEIRKAPSASA